MNGVLIDQEDLLQNFELLYFENLGKDPNSFVSFERIKELIENAAEVESVVYCKDCQYYNHSVRDLNPWKSCQRVNGMKKAEQNDFCSYGRKRRMYI